MTRIRLALGVLAATVALSAFAPAVQRTLADLTGTWSMNVSTPNGDVAVTAALKQSGDSVSGTISSDVGGQQAIAGVFRNDTLRAAFTADMQGTPLPIQVIGVLSDSVTISGVFEIAGMGGFPFMGKKQAGN